MTLTDTIILDVTPENEALTATNTDQTVEFAEDASATTLTTIVVSENDTIQASTDDITASDDTTDETVTVTIALSDSSAGSFSADTGSGESFSSGTWSISGVSVATANTALASLTYTPTSIMTKMPQQR